MIKPTLPSPTGRPFAASARIQQNTQAEQRGMHVLMDVAVLKSPSQHQAGTFTHPRQVVDSQFAPYRQCAPRQQL